MSLTRSDIMDDASNPTTFNRGETYYNEGRVHDFETFYRENSPWWQVTASIDGMGNTYHVKIEMDDYNDVMGYYCNCPAYMEYSGACKHIVATMLHLQTELKKRQDIDRYQFQRTQQLQVQTDQRIVGMIRRRMNRTLSAMQNHQQQEKVSVQPRIERGVAGELALSFTIGNKRNYVIKDLAQFYIDMIQGNEVTYGKALTFYHHANHFEEDSLPMLQYLMDKCSENLAYRQTRYYETGNKRTIMLSPRAMDELFTLIRKNETIAVKLDSGNKWVNFFTSEENPKFSCHVESNDDYFTVGVDLQRSELFRGEKHLYVFDETQACLYQCDETYTEKMADFLLTMDGTYNDVPIHKEDMGVFCTSILDDIKPYVQIVGDLDQVEPCRPMPLKTKVYIDVPIEGRMEAKIEYEYGDYSVNAYDEESIINVQRDICAELLARQMIEKHFEEIDLTRQKLISYYTDDKLFDLANFGFDEMRQVADVYIEDSLKVAEIQKPPAVSIGVGVESDLLNLQFDTGEFPLDELMGVLSSYQLRKRYHRMKDGSFLDLHDSALSDLSELADGLGLKEKDLANGEVAVPMYRAMYVDSVIKHSSQIKSQRDSLFKDMVKNMRNVDDVDVSVPESLRMILRNYQETGYRWLQTMTLYRFGGILADDMGLGKTLQVIAVLLNHKQKNQSKGMSFVTCPSSLVLNWEAEIRKFAPELSCQTVMGSAETRKYIIENAKDVDVLVTSYDSLKRDVEYYQTYKFEFHIIDEAQYIKNQNTQNAKAVKAIKSKQRFALTGTPIENRLSEIWSIFSFLMPGYLYSYAQFRKRFESPIVKDNDERARENLLKLIQPFVLRRLKRDVLTELPEKTESVVYADMNEEQRKLYMANLVLAKEEAEEKLKGGGTGKMQVLALLMRLRQLCCHPMLCYEDYSGHSAKLNACLELVEESIDSGHKVLLFSQFTSMLAIIEREFKQKGISYYLLKGDTKKEDRARMVEEFNHNDINVFLISLKAGGTGLNLTGADVVIHYDPWWNVSAQNQATDRAHRIGQNNAVQVYKLIAQNTIEDKILQLQEKKKALADSVIAEGGASISVMTHDEIMALFD